MSTTTSDIDKRRKEIIEKILKLKEVSNTKGNTEGEMLQALAAIESLMERYNISLSELEIKNDKYSSTELESHNRVPKYLLNLLHSVGEFFEVKAYITTSYCIKKGKKAKDKSIFKFFGSELDVKLCTYTYEMLKNNMHMLLEQYKNTPEYKQLNLNYNAKTINSSYLMGVTVTIHSKIMDLIEIRNKNMAKNNTTTGLILVKREQLLQAFKAEVGKLRNYQSGNSYISNESYMKGMIDGDLIEITPGIDSKEESLLLEQK